MVVVEIERVRFRLLQLVIVDLPIANLEFSEARVSQGLKSTKLQIDNIEQLEL